MPVAAKTEMNFPVFYPDKKTGILHICDDDENELNRTLRTIK